MKSTETSRIAKAGVVVLQISALFAVWFIGNEVVKLFHLPIPGSLTGMFLLLALLLTGKVKVASFSSGAEWLLREMLLFFIPAVLVIINHPEFFGWIGLKLLVAILMGIVIVMATTAFTVDIWWRLAQRRLVEAEQA